MTQLRSTLNLHQFRKQLVFFLKEHWSLELGLFSLSPLLWLSVAALLLPKHIKSGPGIGVFAGNHLIFLTLVFLGIEILSYVGTMTSYFLNQIFVDEFERADQLVSHCLKGHERELAYNELATNSTEETERKVKALVDQLLRGEMLGLEALARISTFVFLGIRLVIVFTLTTFTLEYANYLKGNFSSAFGTLKYSLLSNIGGSAEVLERSIYSTLVTLATVGYGDMSPQGFGGRVMVDLEIVTAILFLTFGVNMLVALVLDSSRLAWLSRKEALHSHITNGVTQRRTVLGES